MLLEALLGQGRRAPADSALVALERALPGLAPLTESTSARLQKVRASLAVAGSRG